MQNKINKIAIAQIPLISQNLDIFTPKKLYFLFYP